MQKRTLYSLLLASLLLVFAFSFATAQTVTFQSKTVPRCATTILNITVNTPEPLSAFEIVFTLSGNYSNFSVNFDAGLTALPDRVLQVGGTPDTVRMAAMRINTGDNCLPAGTTVVGQIHLKTGDICSGSIVVSGATITGTSQCGCPIGASTKLVKCSPVEELATTVVAGTVTVQNATPTIACPGPITVPWGTVVEFDVTGNDTDLGNGCETLQYSKVSGPGSVNPTTGHFIWATGGDDICVSTVVLRVTDKCGATADCSVEICVTNEPPVITHDPDAVLQAVWAILLSGEVVANDPDGGPSALSYSLVSFDGPTYYGTGFNLDANTGEWTWDIGDNVDYLGDFTLCIAASDGAEICPPCNVTNADTACYKIHVSGFTIWIEKVHDQLQGHYTTASIYLDSAFVPAGFTSDLIGGFDFLIAYDASALTFTQATPGALIDSGAFEYFTYRFGPFGNCGSGCPSGMLRVVGLRETNNGATNPNHVAGPGELVVLHFFVTNDRTLNCMFVPIRFYWLDCADNVMASENGNLLYLGLKVFDFLGNEITDPDVYGMTGPADSCFVTVYNDTGGVKNAPLGAIIFRNGGIDIICSDSIDARGDINLNGIPNEIGDAVVFTNYFISGLAAFTINLEGQIAATEVNGDGIPLSVADLVYLIRVIVGDALPYAKVTPGTVAEFYSNGKDVTVKTPVDIGGALFVFDGEVTPMLANDARDMELKYATVDGMTRVLVYSMERGRLTSGSVLTLSGEATLISVEAATYYGSILETRKNFVPTEFGLSQNYPNPFNPTTTIELALPVASDWSVSIYNVSGQRVAAFSGYSPAGVVTVNWDAANIASGLYFYKAEAGAFSATKKMVLLK